MTIVFSAFLLASREAIRNSIEIIDIDSLPRIRHKNTPENVFSNVISEGA